ncbi:MAG: multicopper oxidase domain-containing protein, partial [Gammaproteobacteria bacterium]|nr:multicopper oxidase domain-containing protein [Gammaproteobacteria bacterium]
METKTVRRIGVFLATLSAWGLTSLAHGGEYGLVIEKKVINLTGRDRVVPTINGSGPGPALRWREGEEVLIRVTNRLDEPTSLHWHG